ncbi:hypothetical protein JW933_06670 [candidate division FCPU426 bacterium]|nr:hypothetical protein [candidate division FCPU426 bacterium]
MAGLLLRKVLVLGLILFGTSSCYFTSIHPLPKTEAVDSSLLGLWEAVPDETEKTDTPNYLLILGDKSGALQIVVLEGYYEHSETYWGHASRINGEKFLSVKSMKATPDGAALTSETHYSIVHYRLQGRQQLEITLLNEAKILEAVREKQLAGKTSSTHLAAEVQVTATPEEWAVFLKKHPLSRILAREKLLLAKRVYSLPKKKRE